jgi:hypothetical protein
MAFRLELSASFDYHDNLFREIADVANQFN